MLDYNFSLNEMKLISSEFGWSNTNKPCWHITVQDFMYGVASFRTIFRNEKNFYSKNAADIIVKKIVNYFRNVK